MVSTGMTLVKYLLFAFNLLFALSGLALLVIGALIQTKYHHYNQFMDTRIFMSPILLIIVGVVVFIVASFGCCGAIMENHCMVVTFSVFLMMIFVLEVAAGVAAYVLRDQVEKTVELKLKEGLSLYSTDKDIGKAWDILQQDLHCCGIKSLDDWSAVYPNDTLPWSCCSPHSNATAFTTLLASQTAAYEEPRCNRNAVMLTDEKETGVYKNGCLSEFINTIKHNSALLLGVGIGIAVIQIIGVVFSCCLAKSIKREYQTV